MNGNNVRTSVVIEVANQEEPDDQKMYKIDFDDVEPPRGFVIDQVYCGEDVTVYALFEAPEITNEDFEKQLIEVSSSSEELKFYNRSQKALKEYSHKDIVRPKSEQQSCIKYLEGGYEKPNPDDKDMKVLFCKDLVSKMPKSSRFKSVSVGVNTDVAQSPKLLEEVQRAVSLHFFSPKKTLVGGGSVSSKGVQESEQQESFLSLEMGEKCDGKSPNFLLVPLIMMEDGVLSQLKTNKQESVVAKASLGVNTDRDCFEDTKSVLEGDYFLNHSVVPENQCHSKKEKASVEDDTKSQYLDKESILEEIKKLQLKLSCLIQSLEQSNAKNNESSISTFILDCSPNLKQPSNKTILAEKNDAQKPLPVFSSYSLITDLYLPIIQAQSSTHLRNSVVRNASSIIKKPCDTNSFQNLDEFVDWGLVLNKRGPGTSKSECRNFTVEKCTTGLKRSMSLTLIEVKPDSTGFKKLKNAFFKLDGTVKSKEPTRAIITEENLSDKFPLLKCEMGDEAQEKLKCSKVKVNKVSHNEPEVLKSARMNEEEGDAKILREISEKVAVHYCTANVTPPKVVKEEKSVPKTKPGSVEKETRTETGKSPRKANDGSTKKDVKMTTKTNSKSKIAENQAKSTVAEAPEEIKQKTPARKPTARCPAEHRGANDKSQKKAVDCPKPKQRHDKLLVKDDVSGRPRPSSQKRDRRDVCLDAKVVTPKKEPAGPVMVFEKKGEGAMPSKRENKRVSSNPSSVIVELFSKKPACLDEIGQKKKTGDKKTDKDAEKSVAKSVWALTKVLLYEDGTKKFEVLEASLTPPEYSLQNGKKQEVSNL